MSGKALRKLRLEAGMTQEQLAVQTGISVSSIMKYERDEVGKPSYEHVSKLAHALANALSVTVNIILTLLEGTESVAV